MVSIILLAFTVAASNVASAQDMGANTNSSPLGIQVTGPNGLPLANVTVQGIMYASPDHGYGSKTVFVQNTNPGGHVTLDNLNRATMVLNNWTHYHQLNYNTTGYPGIILLFTYHTSNGTYVTMGSLNMTGYYDFMHGISYIASVHFPMNSHDKLIKTPNTSANNNANSDAVSSVSVKTDSSTLPTSIIKSVYYVWEMQSHQTTPTISIPIDAVHVGSNVEAYVQANAASDLNYNVGFALNPSSTSSAQYNAGDGTGYYTTSSVSGTYSFDSGENVYTTSSGSTGYVYMNAQIEGAYYELYELTSIGAYAQGQYLYDTCIVNVQVSGSSIVSSSTFGVPSALSYITNHDQFVEVHSAQAGKGEGNLGSQYYQLSMQYLVDQYTGSDTSWMNFGIGIGAILVGVVSLPAGVALGVAALLWGTIQWGSGFSAASGYVQYDAPTNYDMNVFAIFSSSSYLLTNGDTGTVPMLYVEVSAYIPSTSGGGGGCVVNGTEITLANGSTIPVQDLKPGMKTLSYDTSTSTYLDTTVSKVTPTNVSSYIEINHKIGISGLSDQPVYVKLSNGTKEWITLGLVNYSMQIFNAIGNTWNPIKSINLINKDVKVYDVVTAQQFLNQGQNTVVNDYIANGFLLDKKLA